MTVDDMRTELEEDLKWRQDEIRFFGNIVPLLPSPEEQNKFRKSLVLVLYSHLEGFMKVSLLTYIKYLNSLGLKNKDVVIGLKASSLNMAFRQYEDTNVKHKDIKDHDGKTDGELDKFYRRVQLLSNFIPLENNHLLLDDEVINTESNLWYVVLQKNLYKIGLPIDLFEENKSEIDSLVNRRNGIAHGNKDSGITEKEYTNWYTKINKVLNNTVLILYEYAKNEKYLLVKE